MALNCGMNILPTVSITVIGFGLSHNAKAASDQALANADAKAYQIAASWGFNYPCPEECNYQTIGIKIRTSTTTVSAIHLLFFTIYWAKVILNFQPTIFCTQIP